MRTADKLIGSRAVRTLAQVVETNANLLTFFTVCLVVLSGAAVADDSSRWWAVGAAVLSVAVLVLLLVNLRVAVKAAGVTLLTLMLAATAFTAGSALDLRGTAGLTWLGAHLAAFFGVLAYTYAWPSYRSRWSVLGASQVVLFAATYPLVAAQAGAGLSVACGAAAAALTAFCLYSLPVLLPVRAMPSGALDERTWDTFCLHAQKAGWSTAPCVRRRGGKDLLVWKERAYLLHPVGMEQPFAARGHQLTYKGRRTRRWLNHLLATRLPVWRTRNADITLVLLDVRRRNGPEAKVVPVPVPDSRSRVPVLVVPAPAKWGAKQVSGLLRSVDTLMADLKEPLTEAQMKAASRVGATGEEDKEPEGE